MNVTIPDGRVLQFRFVRHGVWPHVTTACVLRYPGGSSVVGRGARCHPMDVPSKAGGRRNALRNTLGDSGLDRDTRTLVWGTYFGIHSDLKGNKRQIAPSVVAGSVSDIAL